MGRELVVVGASAGGIEPLREVVAGLPPDLPAAVLVVMHVSANARSALPLILGRASQLPADHAVDGEQILPGRVYVAPPNHHLVVRDGRMVLGLGPRENGLRPAIDPLFRSASRWYGAGVVGVILSGTLDDGAAGVATIAARGGRVIVHDPEEAAYDGMPRAAIRAVHPDAVVPAAKMAAYISEWTREETPPSPPVDRDLAMETDVAELDEAALSDPDRPGTPAAITCPDCNGPLFEISNDVMRFRCRVGHAWSPDSLVAEQVEQAEGALWVAMRSLEERAELHRRLGRAADQRSHDAVSRRHQRKAREAAEAAQTIRQMVRLPIIPAEPAPGSQSY